DDERRAIAAAGWERARRDYNEAASFQHIIRAVNEVRAKRQGQPEVQARTPCITSSSAGVEQINAIRESTTRKSEEVNPAPAPARPLGKILLHTDSLYLPDQWFHRFAYLLPEHYHL